MPSKKVLRYRPLPINYFDMSKMMFDTHIRIFKHLRVRDLLQIRKVNTTWRYFVEHPSVWETMDMEGMMVKDWIAFFEFANSKNVRKLDLKKMRLRDDISIHDAWVEFAQAVRLAKTIQQLSLRSCPCFVGDAVIKYCPQMHFLIILECNFVIDNQQMVYNPGEGGCRDVVLDLKNMVLVKQENMD